VAGNLTAIEAAWHNRAMVLNEYRQRPCDASIKRRDLIGENAVGLKTPVLGYFSS